MLKDNPPVIRKKKGSQGTTLLFRGKNSFRHSLVNNPQLFPWLQEEHVPQFNDTGTTFNTHENQMNLIDTIAHRSMMANSRRNTTLGNDSSVVLTPIGGMISNRQCKFVNLNNGSGGKSFMSIDNSPNKPITIRDQYLKSVNQTEFTGRETPGLSTYLPNNSKELRLNLRKEYINHL